MSESQVSVERHDRVAVLTLHDPKRRNALNLDMCEQMVAEIETLEADPSVGALVVTGEDPAFCAGADLSQLGASQADGLRRIYSGFLKVASTSLPTVAAVNGAAVGAGMNLALACDVRIAAHSARFDTRFLDLGIHPGGGHTWMMHRIVGPQAAAAMVLFGQQVNGTQAEQVGLVWEAVEDGTSVARAIEIAARAASGPPELVATIKSSLRSMPNVSTHAEAVDLELEPQVWSINQPAFAERLAALQQRITSR